jgi:hypothetical protein
VYSTEPKTLGAGARSEEGAVRPFFDAQPFPIARATARAPMDDLTAQEREMIMTFRRLRSFTVIVHRNERWRIIVADEQASGTRTGEGEDFGTAWDSLNGNQ